MAGAMRSPAAAVHAVRWAHEGARGECAWATPALSGHHGGVSEGVRLRTRSYRSSAWRADHNVDLPTRRRARTALHTLRALRDEYPNYRARGDDDFLRGSDSGGFFSSPVVIDEGQRLMRDHAEMLRLGQKYKSFDREGKLAYVSQMESIFDRWKVFLKRFELSDDFQAQLYLKQLDAWLSRFGMKRADMLQNLEMSLDMMRQEAEREP